MYNSKILTDVYGEDINPELNLVKLSLDIPETGFRFNMSALDAIFEKYRILKTYEYIKKREDAYGLHLVNEDIEEVAIEAIKQQDYYGIDKDTSIREYIKNLIIAKCEAYLNFKRIKR